jgi:hypothetical protein
MTAPVNTCDVATIEVWIAAWTHPTFGFGSYVFLTKREAQEWTEYMTGEKHGTVQVTKHRITAPIVKA